MSRAARNLECHSSTAERLLGRLEGIERSGSGWRARCPTHGSDKNRALSITVADDGRVLLHCFAGCKALDVVQAIGLELTDLFPERITADTTPAERRRIRELARQSQWAAALDILEFEARVVIVAAGDIHNGKKLSDRDAARLHTALERIESARLVLRGR